MNEPTEQQRWKELQKRLKQAKATLKVDGMGDLFTHAMRGMAKSAPHLHTTYSEELKEFS